MGNKRILIVDDDPDLCDLISLEFSRTGYEVITAASGEEALRKARAQPMDLILLDVMMPGMDGYHVAQELTTSMGDRAPKIIIMTARNVQNEKGIGLMSGAVDMVQKPFSTSDLREKVEKLLT
ncbi:response regulator transcription factor [Elusimicrobiota bacterium]